MKRLFISQPMRGKTDTEIIAERARAKEKAEKILGEEVEEIPSFFKEEVTPDNALRSLYLLGESIELLSTADVAFFVKGWEGYRGCRIENQCAIDYGITTIEDYGR